ncbi:MAG: DsrE family protein [Gammaproteobacteria bacterium]|nr:DsrE family protein [Gammaproteobacteria bacterium]
MRALLVLLGLAWAGSAAAESSVARVAELLAAPQAPDGVVFEIMQWEDRSWDWAVPLLDRHVADLRARFPGLDVALVSHGAELFELTRAAGLAETAALRQLAELHRAGVRLHVCGEYASWKQLGQDDFLSFVDVAPSGSAQLADYVRLGFVPIRLESNHALD